MAVMLANWLAALQALLPPGRAFTRESGSVLTSLLSAVAAVLASVQNKIDAVALEADPRQAQTMLTDWEAMLGLPDACMARSDVLLTPGLYAQSVTRLKSFSRATIATYVDAAGVQREAALNSARYENGNLLIEAAGTNLVDFSNAPANPYWTQSGLIITPNATLGPNGAMSASKVVASTANTAHRYFRGIVLPAGQIVTRSVYVKAAEHARFRLYVDAPGGNSFGASFNLSTGANLAFGVAGTGFTLARGLQALAGGWFRCWVSGYITGQTDYYFDLRMIEQSGSAESWAGDGVGGLFVYGDQFELGAAPTSFIATTGTALARAEDVAYQLSEASVLDRQKMAYQRLVESGGQSRAYFSALAALLDEPGVTITEFAPMHCNDDCNDALYSPADAYVWQVNIPRAAQSQQLATCNSHCNDFLSSYKPSTIECAFQERKPAHTQAIFAYSA